MKSDLQFEKKKEENYWKSKLHYEDCYAVTNTSGYLY